MVSFDLGTPDSKMPLESDSSHKQSVLTTATKMPEETPEPMRRSRRADPEKLKSRKLCRAVKEKVRRVMKNPEKPV